MSEEYLKNCADDAEIADLVSRIEAEAAAVLAELDRFDWVGLVEQLNIEFEQAVGRLLEEASGVPADDKKR